MILHDFFWACRACGTVERHDTGRALLRQSERALH